MHGKPADEGAAQKQAGAGLAQAPGLCWHTRTHGAQASQRRHLDGSNLVGASCQSMQAATCSQDCCAATWHTSSLCPGRQVCRVCVRRGHAAACSHSSPEGGQMVEHALGALLAGMGLWVGQRDAGGVGAGLGSIGHPAASLHKQRPVLKCTKRLRRPDHEGTAGRQH